MAGRRKPDPAKAPFPKALAEGWLLFIHQLPPKPAYLRVKAWRRLNALGAVALKNTVYALPNRDDTLEDFQWLRREIVADGGDATVVAARIVDGMSDGEVVALFNAARDADYAALALEARRLRADQPDALADALPRFRRRLAEIAAIDFFGATGNQSAAAIIAEVAEPAPVAGPATGIPQGAVWVTRRSVHVDRIASAWLIRRFLDPKARFRFVERDHRPRTGEVRFDMFEAEFTHEGDRCTFEVLLARAGLVDPALAAIAEIVHDLDLKDEKFRRPEAAGIAPILSGIAAGTDDDDARLERGGTIFDDLYRHFSRRVPTRKRP